MKAEEGKIEEAYLESMRELYGTLVESLADDKATSNPVKADAKAFDRFRKGLAIRRRARDAAIQMISET
jgi:hypothetical protein